MKITPWWKPSTTKNNFINKKTAQMEISKACIGTSYSIYLMRKKAVCWEKLPEKKSTDEFNFYGFERQNKKIINEYCY